MSSRLREGLADAGPTTAALAKAVAAIRLRALGGEAFYNGYRAKVAPVGLPWPLTGHGNPPVGIYCLGFVSSVGIGRVGKIWSPGRSTGRPALSVVLSLPYLRASIHRCAALEHQRIEPVVKQLGDRRVGRAEVAERRQIARPTARTRLMSGSAAAQVRQADVGLGAEQDQLLVLDDRDRRSGRWIAYPPEVRD